MAVFIRGRALALSILLASPLSLPALAENGGIEPARLGNRVVEQVVAGSDHSCARIANGAVMCWGRNFHGQLGDGTNDDSTRAVRVVGLRDVMDLSAGEGFTCAVTGAGVTYCWGANDSGQLGDGTFEDRNTPGELPGLDAVRQVAAGVAHSCAVTTAGAALCWGSNAMGQLGDGTDTDSATPVQVLGDLDSRVVQIGSGAFHSCALRRNGSMACWGDNTWGQLGDGNIGVAALSPTDVIFQRRAAQMAVGQYHACALRQNGVVFCWGYNGFGALGDGSTTDRDTPVRVKRISNAVQVAAGGFFGHSCAVTSAGTGACWGQNQYGQLGDGTRRNRVRPVAVSDLEDIAAIVTGSEHSCAHTVAGKAYCWGGNSFGQLGDRSTRNRRVPVPVR